VEKPLRRVHLKRHRPALPHRQAKEPKEAKEIEAKGKSTLIADMGIMGVNTGANIKKTTKKGMACPAKPCLPLAS
jgi:hypothetical protein